MLTVRPSLTVSKHCPRVGLRELKVPKKVTGKVQKALNAKAGQNKKG